MIDCAITGTLGGYSARWYESATHLYTLPINFGAGATVANAEWWDSSTGRAGIPDHRDQGLVGPRAGS